MSDEIIIGNLLTRIMRYSNKYEISVQFWPEQWTIFIAKDGVDLQSYGGEPENTLKRGIEYLDRINRIKSKY
jgi:hypothetical protein